MQYHPATLKALIETSGLSESELARKAGLAKGTIQKARSEQANPKAETLGKLASAFGVPVDKFFARSSPFS